MNYFLIYILLVTEKWKDISWYEWLYMVSSFWRIKSFIRWKKKWWELWRILSPWDNWKWYLFVNLKGKINIKWRIHRIVATEFLKNDDLKNIVNHIDWNPLNNHIYNLEWCTQSENTLHWFNINKRVHNMIWKIWKDSPQHKQIKQYSLEWDFIKKWECMADVNRELWIRGSSLYLCNKWKYKQAWWFIWKYNYSEYDKLE